MQANNRLPDFLGDLRAQIGAAQLGARRLGEMVATATGAAPSRQSVDYMIDYARPALPRRGRARGPTASTRPTRYVDHDPLGNPDIHVHVKITVDGDRLTLDFTGTRHAARAAGVVDVRQHARLRRRPDREP